MLMKIHLECKIGISANNGEQHFFPGLQKKLPSVLLSSTWAVDLVTSLLYCWPGGFKLTGLMYQIIPKR